MPRKVITADAILRMKGIEKKNFDTNAFNEVVQDFFLSHGEWEKLYLEPQRFVEWINPPEKGFVPATTKDEIISLAESEDNPTNFYGRKDAKMSWRYFSPRIYIDENFIATAAHYLKVICGFTVNSYTRDRKRMYEVYLPI